MTNTFLCAFVEALKQDNRDFGQTTELDENFLNLINNDFDSAKNIETKEDIFSFYFLCALDDFVSKKIRSENSFNIDEYGVLLTNKYYTLLKNKLLEISNQSLNLDDIRWVFDSLNYIDNKCMILSFSKDRSVEDSVKEVSENIAALKLANQRINEMQIKLSNLNDNIKVLENTWEERDKKATKLSNDLKAEIAQQEKRSTETSITIVGIFVAIVTVLFGGISFINAGLSGLEFKSIKLFLLIGVLGLILFDSILALFYFMSKLTNHPIVSKLDCWKSCPQKHRKFKRIFCSVAQKSKFAFWINFVLIDYILFLFILYIISNHGWFDLGTNNGISLLSVIISGIIPFALLIATFILTTPCDHYMKIIRSNTKIDSTTNKTD